MVGQYPSYKLFESIFFVGTRVYVYSILSFKVGRGHNFNIIGFPLTLWFIIDYLQ